MDKHVSEHASNGVMRDLIPTAPPISIAGMTLMGIPLSDWVLIATLVYTGVQIIIVMPKAIAVVRKWFR